MVRRAFMGIKLLQPKMPYAAVYLVLNGCKILIGPWGIYVLDKMSRLDFMYKEAHWIFLFLMVLANTKRNDEKSVGK